MPVVLCTGDRSDDVTMQRCLRLAGGVSRGMLVAQGDPGWGGGAATSFNGRCGMSSVSSSREMYSVGIFLVFLLVE